MSQGPQRGGQSQQGSQGHQQTGQGQQGYQQRGPGTSFGLDPNVAAALSYVLGWITGLVFFLIEDDNQFIRFHAMQSILLSIVFIVVGFPLSMALALGGAAPLLTLYYLAVLGISLFLIYQAYNWEWYQLPVIGDFAMDQSPPSQTARQPQGNYQQSGRQGNYQQGGQNQGNYQQSGQQQGGQQGNYQQGGQDQGNYQQSGQQQGDQQGNYQQGGQDQGN